MLKLICTSLFLTTSLFALATDYDKLYNNIAKDDDNQTQETIRKYVFSSYNIAAHKTNYFLPISYRINNNYQDTASLGYKTLQMETEFQLSIKYDIATNLLGYGEVYVAAYTQKAFWQIYAESIYFRETNYAPEIFVKFPVALYKNSSGLKAMQFGLTHQSNGRGKKYAERSWNYFYTSIYFQIKSIFVDLRLWTSVGSLNHNKDLMDYLGYGYVQLIAPYKKHFIKTKAKYSFKGNGSIELNYSYPVPLRDDLFFYIKAFDGYGESLIDYNERVQKIGIGFSISR